MKRTMMFGWSAAVAAWMLAAGPLQAAYVELPNGTKIEGTEMRSRANGDIIFLTPAGQRTFSKGQYVTAVADKPAEFDQARTLVGSKQFDQAIPLLQKIIRDFQFLTWDNNARLALAQVYVAKGDHAAAATAYEDLLKNSEEARNDSASVWGYREALLASKQMEKLNAALDETVAKGSRADAAKAQLMRGDIKAGQGQLEGAVLDYLRTAIMFTAEKEVHPEALYKAAEALEKLRDPRAKEMYKKLVQMYPQSTYAQKAQGKT